MLMGREEQIINERKRKLKELIAKGVNPYPHKFDRKNFSLEIKEKYKKLNKNEYMKMAHELVNKYAIDNGLAENVKKMVEKLVVAQWKNLKGEIKK